MATVSQLLPLKWTLDRQKTLSNQFKINKRFNCSRAQQQLHTKKKNISVHPLIIIISHANVSKKQ